jgi:two-component system, LytTR family, sensor kinase
MIKDGIFKGLFIPAIGLLIPLGAGLVPFSQLNHTQLLFTLVFFIFISHAIWQGTVWIINFLRTKKGIRKNISYKLTILSIVTVLYGAGAMFVSSGIWQVVVIKSFFITPLLKSAAIMSVVVLVLALIYESIFLSAEIELDEKVMQQLNSERLQAQANVLQNELDPHFLFNCLNTLSYLVKNDPQKAYQFVHKLSNVFKYLLVNKHKDYVTLQEEIAFLEDYYFLLRVRFDDGIKINNLLRQERSDALILPCTLQTLVENAIKHNVFSEKEPLEINLEMNKYFILVSNPVRPKLYKANSTKTGLSNLQSRYQLIMERNIVIQQTSDRYLVKIPFEKNAGLSMVS